MASQERRAVQRMDGLENLIAMMGDDEFSFLPCPSA